MASDEGDDAKEGFCRAWREKLVAQDMKALLRFLRLFIRRVCVMIIYTNRDPGRPVWPVRFDAAIFL